jgi:hypothetical protein
MWFLRQADIASLLAEKPAAAASALRCRRATRGLAQLIRIRRIKGENHMKRKTVKMIALGFFALALALGTARHAQAQDAKNPYPSMAP